MWVRLPPFLPFFGEVSQLAEEPVSEIGNVWVRLPPSLPEIIMTIEPVKRVVTSQKEFQKKRPELPKIFDPKRGQKLLQKEEKNEEGNKVDIYV